MAVSSVKSGITMAVEDIGPAKAREYMKLNINNPRGGTMSRSVIKSYAEDMKAGLWQLNGEPIVFDEDGFLKDGQHRLAAILMSGVTIRTVVIRGVAADVDIYNWDYGRNVAQAAHCNPTISAAARIVVTNFRASPGKGRILQYINGHLSELERSYRITCYGNGPEIKSKCAPCVAASYLALRTESLPSYELELFFRIFNSYGNCSCDGYDISPSIVARKMFDERGSFSSGYQIQKEKLEIVVSALQDFHSQRGRTDSYKISEPFHFQEWMQDVRGKDGLN